MRKLTAKFSVVLLLFLFVEKAGMRLWIHDYVHSSPAAHVAGGSEKESDHKVPNLFSAGCDCVDDFFLPLTYTENISFPFAPISTCEKGMSFYKSYIALPTCSGRRHRGPPFAC